jgi:hypothetical protein
MSRSRLVRISLLTAGALVLASVPGIAAAAPAGTGVVKAPASTSATKTPPLSTTPATTAKAAGTATTAKVGSGPASGAKKTAAAPGTTTAKHPKAGVAGDLDNEKGSPGIHLPHSGGGLKTKLASIATTTQGQLVAAATPAAAQAAAAQASVATAALAANDPCQTTPVNAVACENSKVGTPDTVWDVSGAGDTALAGFATDISVNVGQTVHFKVKSTGAYRLDLYRATTTATAPG